GAIARYSEWPRFGELVGFTWVWGMTNHSPVGDYDVRVMNTGHPIVTGIGDFTIHDELYYDVRITPGMTTQTHAVARWRDQDRPMVMTADGGRIAGAGKIVYLGNGHDLR